MSTKQPSVVSRRDFNKATGAAAIGTVAGILATHSAGAPKPGDAHSECDCDVVIVGAGCAGALVANDLARRGFRVLVLEAGPYFRHPADQVGKFFAENVKTPDAPWPSAVEANRPKILDMDSKQPVIEDGHDVPGFQRRASYLIQNGKIPFNSTYERVRGGTLNHWLGTALRHVPNDFRLSSAYGVPQARDWPLSYADLECWYDAAEREVGVAGDSEAYRSYLGAYRSHEYPMLPIPQSYLDQRFIDTVHGRIVNGRRLNVLATPQARNSRDFDGRPRCQGNSSCVPICPIQAKYDATVHLNKALAAGATIQYQCVAYQVVVGPGDRITGIKYKQWGDGPPQERCVTAKLFVLAAHAIETAKLLLISPWKQDPRGKLLSVANASDQVGRNLMDHICYLAWGMTDQPVYPYRGPLSTSGIGDFRDGADGSPDRLRGKRAAYRIEIGNDGLVWPAGAPGSTVVELVNAAVAEFIRRDMQRNNIDMTMAPQFGAPRPSSLLTAMLPEEKPEMKMKTRSQWFGAELRDHIAQSVVRHVRLAGELEALPLPESRVTVSKKLAGRFSFDDVPENEKDALGIPKPQVNYVISEYTKRGFVEAVETLHEILRLAGVNKVISNIGEGASPADTERSIPETQAGVFQYEGRDYQYRGAGHIMGTYRMGNDPADSVVDSYCRSHDHQNLFLLGSGVFPSTGTANPTLTIMALALRSAAAISDQLLKERDA